MLFTTIPFAFVFLPLTLFLFFAVARLSKVGAAWWLFLASTAFYAYWMPEYTALLLGSILVNYFIGSRISMAVAAGRVQVARRALIGGVVFGLALLAYFKYSGFFVHSLEEALGVKWSWPAVVLPIGISFFTFTQIAFLADAWKGKVAEYRFSHYALFVTYFPHLVAGPVLHHAQMMPQFEDASIYRARLSNCAVGLTLFGIGLAKKILVADSFSPYADAVFDGAAGGTVPDVQEAWIAALAYTLQLYFDFSGYSDMAIGLSRLFNVTLPRNFDSPYKARSISEFWRRWHMTLSQFLRDYLYIPLGGNRLGPVRRYINLAVTMLLGGLWHGANWTFVLWGGLHGAYLIVHHVVQAATARLRWGFLQTRAWSGIGWMATLLAVIVAWVYFRAPTFAAANTVLAAMAGQGAAAPTTLFFNEGLEPLRAWLLCAVFGLGVLWLPNSNAMEERCAEHCRRSPSLSALVLGAALALCILLIVINETRDQVSAFIYFNF